MQSEHLEQALKAVARERDAFRAAVSATLDQVRALLATSTVDNERAARTRLQLGKFADGRIDASRFADLFPATDRLEPAHLLQARYAQHLLNATLTLGDDAFRLALEPGGDLRLAVTHALSTLGRAFAAAHEIAALRSGLDDRHADELLLAPLPPERWTRAERDIAPPLVVELEGADLRPSGLEELLQGGQKLVLLVTGAAPPAALVRVISPDLFVLQCTSAAELAQLSAVEGPAIAALLPEGAARFVHRPVGQGRAVLDVQFLPAEPLHRVGGITVFQQKQELQWLQHLAASYAAHPEPASAASGEQPQTDPVDRLAAFLLRQVDVAEVGK